MTNVSIVIRAYNEAGPLKKLLAQLAAQEYTGQIETIVVDNGSTDDTAAVAKSYGATIVTLPQAEFTYPKSLNVGIAAAHHPIVLCTVAHACPAGPRWVASAARHFESPKVAGVYSYPIPPADASAYDKLLGLSYWYTKLVGVSKIHRVHVGDFGATNIALRRSLWEGHPFDEQYGAGGEDTVWAKWALQEGYDIVRDPDFTVYHAHYLRTFKLFWLQMKVWTNLKGPRPFNRDELAFRQKRK